MTEEQWNEVQRLIAAERAERGDDKHGLNPKWRPPPTSEVWWTQEDVEFDQSLYEILIAEPDLIQDLVSTSPEAANAALEGLTEIARTDSERGIKILTGMSNANQLRLAEEKFAKAERELARLKQRAEGNT